MPERHLTRRSRLEYVWQYDCTKITDAETTHLTSSDYNTNTSMAKKYISHTRSQLNCNCAKNIIMRLCDHKQNGRLETLICILETCQHEIYKCICRRIAHVQ